MTCPPVAPQSPYRYSAAGREPLCRIGASALLYESWRARSNKIYSSRIQTLTRRVQISSREEGSRLAAPVNGSESSNCRRTMWKAVEIPYVEVDHNPPRKVVPEWKCERHTPWLLDCLFLALHVRTSGHCSQSSFARCCPYKSWPWIRIERAWPIPFPYLGRHFLRTLFVVAQHRRRQNQKT